MKTALISGISGQDGQHLARLLEEKSYRVIGTSRDPKQAAALHTGIEIVALDLADETAITALIKKYSPDEFYNLAAYAVGSTMWDEPASIADINGVAVARILEVIRQCGLPIRFCQASSSEMFGHPQMSPQSEATVFAPRNPYGAAKLYAHNMVRIYRAHYSLFACSAILFNHESPERAVDFVTRKITFHAAKISLGLARELPLGNLDARRDWGYAGDYMAALWMMLQHSEAMDYVVASGATHSVRQVCEVAFSHVGLDYRDYVVHADNAWRQPELVQLVGDSSQLRNKLGWEPQLGFRDMIHAMVDRDLQLLKLQIEGKLADASTD